MTQPKVLITAYNAAGRPQASCGPLCYNSPTSLRLCPCICGGHAHGMGLPLAITRIPRYRTQIRHLARIRGFHHVTFHPSLDPQTNRP